MRTRSGRWVEVTPSRFPHERAGLEHVRALFPDHEPYRAWTNLEIITDRGRSLEVDLLVLGPGGLYLIELKGWNGRVTGDRYNWQVHQRGTQTFTNPCRLANDKARFSVFAGRSEIGRLHPLALAKQTEGPRIVLLAGRSWIVQAIDWRRHRCSVEPLPSGSGSPGRTKQWRGTSQPLHFALCQAMRSTVLGVDPGVDLSRRAHERLAEIRNQYRADVNSGGTVIARDGGDVRWWTWAGGAANLTLSAALPAVTAPTSRTENLWLHLRADLNPKDMEHQLRTALDRPLPPIQVSGDAVRGLKFSVALPHRLAALTLGERLSDPSGAQLTLAQPRIYSAR